MGRRKKRKGERERGNVLFAREYRQSTVSVLGKQMLSYTQCSGETFCCGEV